MYSTTAPSGPLTQAICGSASAKWRKRDSDPRRATSACLRSSMSSAVPTKPTGRRAAPLPANWGLPLAITHRSPPSGQTIRYSIP